MITLFDSDGKVGDCSNVCISPNRVLVLHLQRGRNTSRDESPALCNADWTQSQGDGFRLKFRLSVLGWVRRSRDRALAMIM
jgi:hypothetical protein